MTDKILVTGATGTVGRELVGLLADSAVEVKAGTRRPDRARSRFGPLVEVVELDYDATETWDAAVQWADRVFLVPPAFDPRGDERLVPFLDWAVQSGARHMVLLSAMGVDTRERLALRRIEQRIEKTGVAWTFLRPNVYMQNFARDFLARSIRDAGVFQLPAGDAPVSFVDSRDVAAVAAEALSGEAHFGSAYTLTGPRGLSHAEAAQVISDVVGREVRYEDVPESALRDRLQETGWSDEQAATFAGLLASIREGERAAVTADVAAVLGREPGEFESFARDCREVWG